MKKIFYITLLALVIMLVGCTSTSEKNNPISGEKTKDITISEAIKETEAEKEVIYNARLKFMGDVFPHSPEIRYAKKMGENNRYNFNYAFELVKDFMKDADLTVLNNEFTSNPEWKISAYPTFNIPHEIFEAFKNAGVDVVTTANNHSLDTRFDGLHSTIDYLDKYEIKHTGTQKNSNTPYLIMDVNGIKVGLLSYTEYLNGFEAIIDTPEKKAKINILEKEKIKKDILRIRNEGAEFVVVYPHWGNEYQSYPKKEHIDLGRNMIEWGADLIIGNHPHVVQPKEKYVTEDKRIGYIYYSLGNVFSNQSFESLGDYRTEQGVTVEVKIKKSSTDNKVEFVELIDHPIWTMMRGSEGNRRTMIHLVSDFIENGPKSKEATEAEIKRMEKANEMTLKVLNTKIK